MKKALVVALVVFAASLMMTFTNAAENKPVKECIKNCNVAMEKCKKEAKANKDKKVACKKVHEDCKKACKTK